MGESGRKLIFLYPDSRWKPEEFLRLAEQEYEVYSVSDERDLEPVLRLHPGALYVFDGDDPSGGSRLFLEKRSALYPNNPPPCLAVTSESRVVEDLNVEMLSIGPDETALGLLGQYLDRKQIRGQRRFVRFGSQDESIATIAFYYEEKALVGDVFDISAAGLSCAFEDEEIPLKTQLVDFTLFISDREYIFTGEIFLKRRSASSQLIHVIMFDQNCRDQWSDDLHQFISDSLQAQFDELLRRERALLK